MLSFNRTWRRPDTMVMAAAKYEDGRTAYMRISPHSADRPETLLQVAQQRQATGEIPDGKVVAVTRVK